jgi:hypothetical protein
VTVYTGLEVDHAILGMLATDAPKVPIHEDIAPTKRTADNKVVFFGPFPYAVWRSAVGDDDNRRLSGHKTRLSVPFWLTYVGETQEQAKRAGAYLRFQLKDRRVPVPGFKAGLVSLQESQRIWRDDESVNPLGSPLFYGVDGYAVSITISEFRSTA